MKKFLLSAAACGALLAACEIRQPAIEKTGLPVLSAFSVPDTAYLQSPFFGPVSVRVTGSADGEAMRLVLLDIVSSADPAFVLRDTLTDLGGADDVIALDGVYSASVSTARFAGRTGAFTCRVTAEAGGGRLSDPLTGGFTAVDAAADNPPVISGATCPDTVDEAGITALTLSVRAEDARGAADIDSVWFDLYTFSTLKQVYHGRLFDNGVRGDAAGGDSVFTFRDDVSGTVLTGGRHRIRFQAADRSGSLSNVIVRDLQIIFPDGPPVLSTLSAPDTVSRIDAEPFVISVQVSDPLGLADIDSVFFNVTVPAGGSAAGNPFLMFDDAGYGDETAGDGIFSLLVILDIDNELGDYLFQFQAKDLAGALSNRLDHTITVIN